MTELRQIYKCNICGNIVEILHSGDGKLVCCGKPMDLLKDQSELEYAEKHAPVIQVNIVKIGSVPHPMEEKHYIEWIEADGCRKFLKPGQRPEAEFSNKNIKKARMYCNIHGLWTS